ncbi:AMP-binding protein [Micromonospora sp. C95]|nr:AMP-binding protein [Micromonospora sp. C95]
MEARPANVRSLTWLELDEASRAVADRITAAIGGPGVLAVDVLNTLDGVIALVAALRSGAAVLPIDRQLPRPERRVLLDAVAARFGTVHTLAGPTAGPVLHAAVPDASESPGDVDYLLAGGGTSGLAKVTASVLPADSLGVLGGFHLLLRRTGWRPGQRQLIVGPLYHAAPFTCFLGGLCDGHTIVVTGAFSPAKTLGAIEHTSVDWMQVTPAHLRAVLHDADVSRGRLASLRGVLHTAAPCDVATKRGWILLLGPDRIFETYGATEQIGMTLTDGTQWLARPGTVGKGFMTQIRIMRDGRPVPPGEIGTVYLRRPGNQRRDRPGISHTPGGFLSVGDVGWTDAEGYLFLVGRQDDMMTVGGVNVYPAEIELCIGELPEVADVAVVARQHAGLGSVPHALVVPITGSGLAPGTVRSHCRRRLAKHKVPRTVELIGELPRRDNGKLLRSQLTAAPGRTAVGRREERA